MKLDELDLVATGAELAASAAVLKFKVGGMSRLPRVSATIEDEHAVKKFFEAIDDDLGKESRSALETLANPSRIGVMHYSLGEESISRAILAWGTATGSQVVLMVSGAGEGWHIRVQPVESIVKTISSILLEHIPLQPVDIRCSVTQEAALVFLGALHLLRESRLLALLSHQQPPTAFTVAAVEDVLENPAIEDFRWPFFFMDKILPFSTNGTVWSGVIGDALKELKGRDLVEEVEGSDSNTWQLTDAGYRIALSNHHHLTKVGIRITETDENGRKGHEALLLIRSLQDLFLFDLAGREAAIASADVKSVADLVTNIFGMEADADPEAASGTLHCPACGESLTTGQKFCPACGMDVIAGQEGTGIESRPPERGPISLPKGPSPERRDYSPAKTQRPATKDEKDGSASVATRPKFCKQCGGALTATDKFCKSCGHKVSA